MFGTGLYRTGVIVAGVALAGMYGVIGLECWELDCIELE
jgi:hypothetical protein